MECELVIPRQSRLDAPGTLHHVTGRGIEGAEIFRNKLDRVDFLAHLAELRQWVFAGLCMGESGPFPWCDPLCGCSLGKFRGLT